MGVRVRVRICSDSRCVETSALVNSGFETTDPEIVVPPALAEALGLEASNEIAAYTTAGGGSVSAVRASRSVVVELLLDDREGVSAHAVPSIMPGEEEVIISDRLAHELKIVILDPFEGLWCLRDELGAKVRRSASPELWRA